MDDVHQNYIDAEQVTYEEVASVVSNKDDPDMLCLTFRTWFIGLLLTILQTLVVTYFSYKKGVQLWLDWSIMILLSFLLGKLCEWILPSKFWHLGGAYSFTFNPGSFTLKEHVLIFIMVRATSVPSNLATPFDIQRLYFEKTVSFITEIALLTSLSLIIFGIAGLMRRFLVWPSGLLWPENLPYIILLRTFHDKLVDGFHSVTSNSPWNISRLRFFIIVAICQFFYAWLPNCFMPVLFSLPLLCWINPHNLLLSQLTSISGFAIGSVTLHWSNIKSVWNSPIIVPFWAKVNILLGFISIVWILSPLCYYTNFLQLHLSPIQSPTIFRSKGLFEIISEYIDLPTHTLNKTKYKWYVEQYGDIRFSVAVTRHYSFMFLFITSLITHTLLYHGSDIVKQARTSVSNRNNDNHCFLMSQYLETPEWWFTIVFIVSLISGILACHYGELLEWFHVLLTIIISWILILPYGIIRANTGLVGIDVTVANYIAAILLPNKPINFLTFRSCTFHLLRATLSLISDLKLCHYTKIPPRSLFKTLVVGRIIASLVRCLLRHYLFANIHDMCSQNNINWPCPKTHEDMSFADTWLSTGPKEWFSGIYKPLLWLPLIGAILPIPFWVLHKKFPRITWLKYVHIPIFLLPATHWDSISSTKIFSWLLFGLICHSLIHRWWYNHYSLIYSIALDAGNSLSLLIMFLIYTYTNIRFTAWWDNAIDIRCR